MAEALRSPGRLCRVCTGRDESPNTAHGGGSGRGHFHGTDSLREPPPQPSPASARGSKSLGECRSRSRSGGNSECGEGSGGQNACLTHVATSHEGIAIIQDPWPPAKVSAPGVFAQQGNARAQAAAAATARHVHGAGSIGILRLRAKISNGVEIVFAPPRQASVPTAAAAFCRQRVCRVTCPGRQRATTRLRHCKMIEMDAARSHAAPAAIGCPHGDSGA
jgi:hypothetical protein